MGSANAGGMRAVLGPAAPGDRAGLLATLMTPTTIALGYEALVLVATGTALLTLRRSPADS